MGSSRKTTTKIRKQNRDALIFKHYIVEGLQRPEVAALASCSVTTVTNVAKRLAAAAVARLETSVDDYMLEQADRLDFVIEQALEEWSRSKLTRKTVKTRTAAIFDKMTGKVTRHQLQEKETTEEERDGDAKFLQEARAALRDQRELLGRGAPTLVDAVNGAVNSPGATRVAFREVVVNMEQRPDVLPGQAIEAEEVE